MLTFVFHCLKNIEVHPVLLGRSVIRIPVSMFWPGNSSTNFYKATENPNSNSTKNQHSDHCLPGWYALDEPNNGRPERGEEHIDFSLTATGVHNKSDNISTVANPETRILEPGNRLSQHDSNLSPINKTIIQTDASQKGSGEYCQKMSIGGQWNLRE